MAKKKKKALIGAEEVRKAHGILQKYKEGKGNLDQRIIDNEQWFKLLHWEQIRPDKDAKEKPTSAWLFNSIMNKHADAMDSYPEAIVLPREESDKADAVILTEIINCILDNNKYEQTYNDKWWRKLKAGFSIEGVFWNNSLLNGLGDIDVTVIDPLNMFWKPGINKLEESPNLFHLKLVDNDALIEEYPQLEESLTKNAALETAHYIYDDNVDTSDMSVVIDWYYKKMIDGRITVQFCKFVNEEVLYASENDPMTRAEGFYASGKYPFVMDVLFPEEGTPAGFGYLDIMKDPQLYIDKLSGTILESAEWNAKPRYLKRGDDGINEEELADKSKQIVHVEGSLDESALRPIAQTNIPTTAMTMVEMKINELKETSGNRDVSQGGTQAGVSAASAIAALQEAGSKLARDTNKAAYRAFSEVAERVLELIRQFYDHERCFRITNADGEFDFIRYSNERIRGEYQGLDYGLDTGYRIPVFDFKVRAQKSNAFSTISQNQMAQTFYQMGFFNPQMTDQALACLEMMDFEGKDSLVSKISENGTMYEQLQETQMKLIQLAAAYDNVTGSNAGAELVGIGQSSVPGQPSKAGQGSSTIDDPLGRASQSYRTTNATTARERAQNVGTPK